MQEAVKVSHLLVVGANHRSSSLALRDQMFVDDGASPLFLSKLRQAGLSQAVVLSTCDRVEVILVHEDADVAARIVADTFAEWAGLESAALVGRLYRLAGGDAVRHCFAIASALDSLVIGEPQVLGQVQEAHRIALAAGMVSGGLEALFQAAYVAAMRVRTETAINEGPVSIAAAAVRLARDLHGDLDRCQGLLIGSGDMGGLIAESLRGAGLDRLVVTSPREVQAEVIAKGLNGHTAPFADLANAIAAADIVLSSMSGRQYVIMTDMVREAVRKRRRRPIFFIDAGIPGDIEPAVNAVDSAFLYDLNDLERVAMEGRVGREAASRAAWDIITAEVAVFVRGRVERSPTPIVTLLRQHFDAAREAALAEAGGDADKATRLLVDRLLEAPSVVLSKIAGTDGEALRRLFRLE